MHETRRDSPVIPLPAVASPATDWRLGVRARLLRMVLVALLPPTVAVALFGVDGMGPYRLLVLGAAIGLSVALAYLMSSGIVRDLRALTADAHALAAGISGHRSTVQSGDEIGDVARALNQMADMVERRNSALADSERRYRFLFDSNPLPMWAWDAETTNILAINEAAIEKYGYERDHFLSLSVVDLLDPAEVPRFNGSRLPFSDARQNAGTWMHRTIDGQAIELEVITTSSRRLGRASWLSVGIDVTARSTGSTRI